MEYLVLLDILGIIAFTFTGYILAVKAELDIMGILIVAFISALGGGAMRDVIVDTTPYIFTSPYPITVVVVTVLLSIVFKLHNTNNIMNNYLFIIIDTIGLSIFAIVGASIGLEADFNAGGVIFLGLLTAIGGGIMRDIVLNTIPTVLRNEIYGSIAIILSVLLWGISLYTPITTIIIVGLLIFGIILRLTAIKMDLHLPIVR